VDYKTGTPRDEKYVKKSPQLTFYALAARDALDLGIPAVSFHYLENDTGVTSRREPKDLAEAETIAQETAAGIRAGQFPPRPGWNCKFCDYQLICPAFEHGAESSAAAAED